MNLFNKSIFLENPLQLYKSKNYGSFKVVEYIDSLSVNIMFTETGSTSSVQSSDLRKGDVKDRMSPTIVGVGYVGIGLHKTKVLGKCTKAYTAWFNMLTRCYCDTYHIKYPTYKCCTVSPEWLNFQTFADWFEANYEESFDLDKDIKVKGNKVYSPEFCVFVAEAVNRADPHIKQYTFKDPLGCSHSFSNLSKFCKLNGLTQGCMSAVSRGKAKQHKGWTKA